MSADGSEDRRTLEVTLRHAQAYLAELGASPVGATADLETLRRRLGKPLAEHGVAPDAVIDELVADAAAGLLGSAGGRVSPPPSGPTGWRRSGTRTPRSTRAAPRPASPRRSPAAGCRSSCGSPPTAASAS
jgi:hypothetical protein